MTSQRSGILTGIRQGVRKSRQGVRKRFGAFPASCWPYSLILSCSSCPLKTFPSVLWDLEKLAMQQISSWTHFVRVSNRFLIAQQRQKRSYVPYTTLFQHKTNRSICPEFKCKFSFPDLYALSNLLPTQINRYCLG